MVKSSSGTIKKIINKDLIHNQERYESLIQAFPHGIATVNKIGIITFCNTTFLNLTGYSESEIIGKHISKLPTLRKKDIPKYLKLFPALFKGRNFVEKEFIFITKSEEKYRLLFENMINGFAIHEIVCNKKGKPIDYIFLEVNPFFEQLTGLNRKNIIGKKVTEVLPGIEKDPADWIGKYGKVALTGKKISFEQYAEPLDKWYSVVAFRNKKDQFAVIFQDITEQKRVEAEALEAKIFLERSLSSAADGVLLLNRQGIHTHANPAFRKIFGIKEEDIVGKTIQEVNLQIAPTESAKIIQKRSKRRLKTGEPISGTEITLLNKKDKTISISYSASGIKDSRGDIIGEVIFLRDITKHKKVEKEIESLSRFVSENPNPVIRVSNKYLVLYANQHGKKLLRKLGYKKGGKVPKFLSDLMINTSKGMTVKVKTTELKIGNLIYELTLTLLEEGNYINIYGKDITELKKTEDELRISRNHYRNLFDNMLEGFAHCKMIFDANGNPVDWIYLQVNKNFELLTGLKNITGKKVNEAIPGIKDSNPELFEIYSRVALTGQPESFEDYIVPLSIWLHLSVFSPVKGEFVAVFQNITERKKAEKEIEDLSRFPSENPNPVIRVSNKYLVLYANQHGKKLLRKLGYKKGGKVPKFLSDLMINTSKGMTVKVKTTELKIGNLIYELTLTLLEEGNYINIYGKDITIQKNAETALKKKQERKEKIITIERTRMERNLHDSVSQMLFSTRLIAEVLPDLWKKDRKEGLKQLERIGMLTKESHSEMRRLLLELKPGSFSEEDLEDLIRQLSQSAKLHLDIPIKITIGGRSKKLSSKVKEVFYRICQEALNNIIKHSGASKINIELIYFPEKTYLKIEDNGHGFTKRKISQKKLGLYIMNERAESINASLDIESRKDKGTSIILISDS